MTCPMVRVKNVLMEAGRSRDVGRDPMPHAFYNVLGSSGLLSCWFKDLMVGGNPPHPHWSVGEETKVHLGK